LAYTDGLETELAYSTASIGRCIATNSEQLSIKVLDMDNANSKVEYTGEYQRPIVSEPLYSYCFTITDNLQTVIATTGEVIWNSEKDSKEAGIYVSRPTFKPEVEMEYGVVYTLTFSITTINGYYTTKTYNFTKAGGYDSYFTGKIIPLVNSEKGCIEITFSGDPMHGHFLLERSSDRKHWDELVQFTMAG
jgi:hypothetical protein